MMFPLVRDLAVDGIPVTVTCRVLGFSTQAFYKWRQDPVTQRDWDDAHLINAAYDIQACRRQVKTGSGPLSVMAHLAPRVVPAGLEVDGR